MNGVLRGAAIVFAIGWGGAAWAQTPATQPPVAAPNGITKLSPADQNFVNKAAIGGEFEVEAGKIAEKQAANSRVRAFAARMVHDHSVADNNLKRIVSSAGGTVPDSLDQEHRQQLREFASQQGADFGRSYMQTMVQDHDHDVQEFRMAAQNLQNPRLKAFAAQTLKVIEQHDRLAHQIAAKMAR